MSGAVAGFTPEELAELREFDAKVDAEEATPDNALDQELDDIARKQRPKKKRPHDTTLKQAEHHRDYSRSYYEAHKAEMLAQQKAYRDAHHEQVCARQRERSRSSAEYHHQYYMDHRDEYREYQGRYRNRVTKDEKIGAVLWEENRCKSKSQPQKSGKQGKCCSTGGAETGSAPS